MRLQPVNYREHWERIKPGVIEVLQYRDDGMIPEDVFAEMRSGNAVLFLCEDCFVIVKQTHTGIGQRVLHIEMAYAFDRRGMDQESILHDYLDELDEIGRKAECQMQSFSSPRRAYDRKGVLPDGWYYATTTWRRRIPQ